VAEMRDIKNTYRTQTKWRWGRIHKDLMQTDCEDGRSLELSLDHIQ
jgi:hypothetical protein